MIREEDVEALAAGAAGDAERFVGHFRALVASAAREAARSAGRSGDDGLVADLCQEAFAALLADGAGRLRQFDPAKGSAASWVSLLARQAAAKALEKERNRPFPLPAGPAGAAPGAVEEADRRERVARLRAALLTLPAREALCLALLYEQGLPAARAAALLRVERPTVYAIRDRALGRLRGILALRGPA